MAQKKAKSFDLETQTLALRDLSDFCLHWPEIKQLVAQETLAATSLSESQKRTIFWLSALAERVCKIDDQLNLEG